MNFLNMGDDTSVYYLAMMLIYTVVGPWVINRLSQSKGKEREELRSEVAASLDLIEKLAKARDAASPKRRAEMDSMIERLTAESSVRISELNMEAQRLVEQPDRRFLIIPTPRTAFAAIVTVLTIASVYFAFMFWLTLGFDFWNRESFDVLNNDLAQRRAMFLAGGGIVLFVIGYCLRFAAFRLFRFHARRMRQEAEARREAEGFAAVDGA